MRHANMTVPSSSSSNGGGGCGMRKAPAGNAAGKVVLAAIVHHDTIFGAHRAIDDSSDHREEYATDYSASKNLTRGADENAPSCNIRCNKRATKQTTAATKSTTTTTTSNTHDEDDADDKGARKRRFGGLFSSTKKKQLQQQQQQQQQAAEMIDNAQGNEHSTNGAGSSSSSNKPAGSEQTGSESQQQQIIAKSPLLAAEPNEAPANHHQYHYLKHQHHHKALHDRTNDSAEQVIEFKFDLIVDQAADNNDAGAGVAAAGSHQANSQTTSQCSPTEFAGQPQSDIMKRKLNDNVNELVESFVLDSSDVCLMCVGKGRRLESEGNNLNHREYHLQQQQQQRPPQRLPLDEFDHLSQLLAHALTYSFQLLEVSAATTVRGRTNGDSPSEFFDCGGDGVGAGAKCQPPAAANYSIELSATLFLQENLCPVTSSSGPAEDSVEVAASDQTFKTAGAAASASNGHSTPPPTRFSMVDLLAADGCGAEPHAANAAAHQQKDSPPPQSDSGSELVLASKQLGANLLVGSASIDCSNIDSALSAIERVKSELRRINGGDDNDERGQRAHKLLIVGLKLKQRINGGLFSNRMCFINFDPKIEQLQPIFELIYNGQALAHLKRRKLHLQSLESALHQQRQQLLATSGCSTPPLTGVSGSSLDSSMEQELEKQHHQVASLNTLIQAEWLLYKQLSSALIRTLIIVHVHKVTLEWVPSSSATSVVDIKQEQRERQQQQAHQQLIEQRLMSENLELLEFARSIQRASAVRLKRRKRHLRSHLASSNVSVCSNISATTTNNHHQHLFGYHHHHHHQHDNEPLISTPLRVKQSPNSRRGHNHLHELPLGTAARKASLDLHLALERHRHRHHRHHHHHHHRHHHHTPQHNYGGHHAAELVSSYRSHTLNNNNNGRRSDFTESSSMSTSSGSQKRLQIRPAASSLQRRYERNNPLESSLNNLSDSDSSTSANLNSCSPEQSSSYNNRLSSVALDFEGGGGRRHHRQRHHQHLSVSRQQDVELKWLATAAATQRHSSSAMRTMMCRFDNGRSPSPVETSLQAGAAAYCVPPSAAPLSSRTPIQIDCHPGSRGVVTVSHDDSLSQDFSSYKTLAACQMSDDNTDRTLAGSGGFEPDNTDNVSDICSVIAEPPKQLKLEEFLNQLSSIIAPITTSTATSTTAQQQATVDDPRQAKQNYSGNEAKEDTREGHPSSNNGSGGFRRSNGGDDQYQLIQHQNIKANGAPNANSASQFNAGAAGLATGAVDNGPVTRMAPPTSCSTRSGGDNLAVPAAADEDDEDCKSHSSILEHLSSLALESNNRLNNRSQQQQQQQQQWTCQPPLTIAADSEGDLIFPEPPIECTCPLIGLESSATVMAADPDSMPAAVADVQMDPRTGHLQRLLNSSVQLKRATGNGIYNNNSARVAVRDPSSLEEQLRTLSISCHQPTSPLPSSASSSSAFTTPSSNNSSCSSFSSSTVAAESRRLANSHHQHHSKPSNGSRTPKQNLYASVIRNHQNVKT